MRRARARSLGCFSASPDRPEQLRHAAGDRRRRVDPGDRPGRQPLQALEQQRIMRAGEHDRVGAPPAARDEAGRDLGRDGGVLDRLRPQRRLGEARRAWREPTSVTSQPWPKSRISLRVYSRATVASVPSTETSLVFEAAQAGLIAGTVPTNGTE